MCRRLRRRRRQASGPRWAPHTSRRVIFLPFQDPEAGSAVRVSSLQAHIDTTVDQPCRL